MKLGIDFGTTRIVAAAADRGNYPLLTFDTREGTADWLPSLVALRGDEQRYGWEAWALQGEPGWTAVRSLKRVLEDAGADTCVEVDGARYPLMELLTGMLGELRRGLKLEPPLEVMLGVPANANSNQRFLTVEAFRRAGFHVLGLLNEPSAAAIEFGHSQKIGRPPPRVRPRGRHLRRVPRGAGRPDPHRARQRGDRHPRRRRLRSPPRRDGGGRGRPRHALGRRALPPRSRSAGARRKRSTRTRARSPSIWTTCARAGARSRSPRPRTTSAAARWWTTPFAPSRPSSGISRSRRCT